jgi:hypothetical protein
LNETTALQLGLEGEIETESELGCCFARNLGLKGVEAGCNCGFGVVEGSAGGVAGVVLVGVGAEGPAV